MLEYKEFNIHQIKASQYYQPIRQVCRNLRSTQNFIRFQRSPRFTRYNARVIFLPAFLLFAPRIPLRICFIICNNVLSRCPLFFSSFSLQRHLTQLKGLSLRIGLLVEDLRFHLKSFTRLSKLFFQVFQILFLSISIDEKDFICAEELSLKFSY